MKFGAQRVLVKSGNSYHVTIPRAMLMHMALFRGCPLELVYDDDTEVITVRRRDPRPAGLYGKGDARGVRPVL